jgi:hypothetical protein
VLLSSLARKRKEKQYSQKHRKHRTSHQIRRLINGEQRRAVKQQRRIKAAFYVPLRLPLVHQPRQDDERRADQEAVVDPGVGRVTAEKDFGPEDAPDYGERVEVAGFDGVPGLRFDGAGEFLAFGVDYES